MNSEWPAVFAVCSLAVWVLLSGLDDLFLQAAFVYLRLSRARREKTDSAAGERRTRRRRIAVFVPLWREQDVILPMLEHNLAAIHYEHYDIFAGVYPNDPGTAAAVAEAAARFENVHVAVCPHGGPTSKADCLNWIYQRMTAWEEEHGAHFDAVVTHDAEDLIHPESLNTIDRRLDSADMVQIPVLPLPTPADECTHGLYCDEFAEYQTRDVVVRQALGGFIAGCGVGTGFSRRALELLAAGNGCPFDPACLTEDYETGFRVRALRLPQVFVPLDGPAANPVATREYFPRTFSAAVRQRGRWVSGIVLQGWERHGWRVPARQLYWLWRDRKAIVGNLLSPAFNLLFLWGAAAELAGALTGARFPAPFRDTPGLTLLCGFAVAVSATQMAIRAIAVREIYGVRMALGVPFRLVFGNFLNGAATVRAMWLYFGARLRRQQPAWIKTDHCYPGRAALMPHKRRLGEILVSLGMARESALETALAAGRAGERIGECLVRTGMLTEDALYEALSVQQGLPLARRPRISRRAAAAVPESVARRWGVLPFQTRAGKLFVAGPELPADEMAREFERYTSLQVRFHLVTPGDFRKLAREYGKPVHVTARRTRAVRAK